MGLNGPRCRKSTHPASAPPPPSGRGHQTSFAQVAADLLGAAVERVYIVIGDANVVKTGGEGGTTRAGVIVNPIVDALRPLRIEDITMPATPFRVWQVIEAARAEG